MHIRTFTWLFLSLAVLIACAIIVVMRMPPISYCQLDNAYPDTVFIQMLQPHSEAPGKVFQLNLTDGTFAPFPGTPMWQYERKVPGIKIRQLASDFQIHTDPEVANRRWRDYVATIQRDDSSEAEIRFRLPPGNPVALDASTVVCVSGNRLAAVDLSSPTQVNFLSVPKGAAGYFLIRVPGAKRFLLKPYGPAGAAISKISLFQVSDSAVIEQLAAWPAGIGEAVIGERIYSTSPSGTKVDIHSALDGKSLGTLQLSSAIKETLAQPAPARLEVIGPLLLAHTATGFKYFDIETQRPLELSRTDLVPIRGDTRPIVFYAAENQPQVLVAYDDVSHKTLWEYRSDSQLNLYGRSDSGKIIVGNSSHGLTVDVLDLQSGKLLLRFTPFKLASWLLPLSEIGFAVWVVVWLRKTVPSRLPVWLNLVFLWAIVISILLLYLHHWGRWPSYPGVPHNYAHGVFLGAMIASLIWLVFGQTRISLRYLPALGILIVLALISIDIFAGSLLTHAQDAIISTIVPAGIVLIALVILRLCRLRLALVETEVRVKPSSGRGVPLRDLFIAASSAALLIAVVRPIRPHFGTPNFGTSIMMAVGALVIGTVVILLATLERNARWFTFVSAVVAITYSAIVVESVFEFATASRFFVPRSHFYWELFRVVTVALVTLHVILVAYRLYGWRTVRWASCPSGS